MVDVNVLAYAFRPDLPQHARGKAVVEHLLNVELAFGLSELVLAGFVRLLTHPKVFKPPSPLADTLAFAEALHSAPNCVIVRPGPRHWPLFVQFCRDTSATGNDVPDAYHAALAVEAGCEWISADRGFAKFAGLQWRDPLDPLFKL